MSHHARNLFILGAAAGAFLLAPTAHARAPQGGTTLAVIATSPSPELTRAAKTIAQRIHQEGLQAPTPAQRKIARRLARCQGETRCIELVGGRAHRRIFVLALGFDISEGGTRVAAYLVDARRKEEVFLESHPAPAGRVSEATMQRLARAAIEAAHLAMQDYAEPPAEAPALSMR